MTTVLVIWLLSIIGTLASASYFGPYPGHGTAHHELDVIRNKRRLAHGDFSNEVNGLIEAIPAGEEAGAYVKIVKKKQPGEEEHDAEEASKDEGSNWIELHEEKL